MSLWPGIVASSGGFPEFLYVVDRDNLVLSKLPLQEDNDYYGDLITQDISLYNANFDGPFGVEGNISGIQLLAPWDLDIDSDGNIYILERNASVVRKIERNTGNSTIYAGDAGPPAGWNFSMTGGYLEGFRTSAKFNRPTGIAVDRNNGIIYIADRLNHRIRKIVISTGQVTTVAGNGTPGYVEDGVLATSTQLNFPQHVAVDSIGQNLYICDSSNHAIRKVNLTTNIITTIAGTPNLGSGGYSGDGGQATSAVLNDPTYICLNKSETVLYISDFFNDRVRQVNLSTGVISTFAGNGTTGYSWPPLGDGGSATSTTIFRPTGITVDNRNNVYITEHDNFRVRRVDINTGIISTVIGATPFGDPYSRTNTSAFSGAAISYPWGLRIFNF